MILKKKLLYRFFTDFIWNIAATFILTFVLQFILYPYLARVLGNEIYGKLLTIMGMANIMVAALGGALNNLRLIQDQKYKEGESGDFNRLLIVSILGGAIICLIISAGTIKMDAINTLSVISFVSISIVRNYWSVTFRLKINYVSNLILNVIIAIGYIVGLCFTSNKNTWFLAFLLGEILGIIYLYKKSNIYKESYKKTRLWDETIKKFAVLVSSNMLANIIIYMDRFLLYSLIGGTQVTIYTVSSFMGKSVGLILSPIAGVLLSYYAQREFYMTLKKYWIINGLFLLSSIILGGITLIFAPWITGLLYPDTIGEAMKYIYIANIATFIGAISSIIMPTVIKYANLNWQIWAQVLYAILYFGLGICFLRLEGIYGFCIAVLIANIFKFIFFLKLGHSGIKKGLVDKVQ